MKKGSVHWNNANKCFVIVPSEQRSGGWDFTLRLETQTSMNRKIEERRATNGDDRLFLEMSQ